MEFFDACGLLVHHLGEAAFEEEFANADEIIGD